MSVVVASGLRVLPVDLADAAQAAAWLDLLDHYAQDPMGGGQGLKPEVKARLVAGLKGVPVYHGGLALAGDEPVVLMLAEAGQTVGVEQADYAWYTAALPEQDYCAQMRR